MPLGVVSATVMILARGPGLPFFSRDFSRRHSLFHIISASYARKDCIRILISADDVQSGVQFQRVFVELMSKDKVKPEIVGSVHRLLFIDSSTR